LQSALWNICLLFKVLRRSNRAMPVLAGGRRKQWELQSKLRFDSAGSGS
jgi:hypothetical protein